jgi:Domain of unknown function (DUF5666)
MLQQLRRLAPVFLLALLAASCAGGGDDVANSGGIGGTGISSGSISSFGSIFVNDIEFDLTGASIRINDLPGCDPKDLCANPLKLGMVVNASVQYNDDGKTGSAAAVEVEPALEGHVTAVGPTTNGVRTSVILGVTVVVSQDDTVIDDALGLTFDNLSAGDVLEVHGFFNEKDELSATRIEKKASGGGPGSEVEIKGKIKQLSDSTPPGTFKVHNLTVHFSSATTLDDIPGSTLIDGLFVEIKGTLRADGGVDASRIDGKQLHDDIATVNLQGIIASVDAADNRLFVLNTAVGPVSVNAAGATFEPTGLVPAPGLEVEVEGALVGGTLVAVKVKIPMQVKIEATVQSKSGSGSDGSLTLLLNPDPMVPVHSLTVEVNGSTKMQDKVGGAIPPFDLDDVNAGVDFLKVKARLGAGGLVATQVKRTDPDDVVLQGPADVPPTGDASGTSGRWVSILSIRFDTDMRTEFEGMDDKPIVDPNDFFSNVHPRSLIKVKDEAPIDGVLEEAGLTD